MTNLTSSRNSPGRGPVDLEFLALDDKLRDEMRRLAQVNDELLGKMRSDPDIAVDTEPDIDQAAQLREENIRLRQRLAEVEGVLDEVATAEENWGQQKKDFDAILEEKSEVIRALHLKVRELQESAGSGAAQKAAESAEIKRLKGELAEQRAQIEQDEEALMQQMRQMEMALSRDRAELARQRNEMTRMQADLNHEIETAARDPLLRERLLGLQRRQQETLARKGGAASTAAPAPVAAVKEQPGNPAASGSEHLKKSGFFGRLFGK